MKIKKITQSFSDELSVNTYVIIDNQDCIIIDPGMVSEELKEMITCLNLKFVLLTHGHYDHTGGLNDLNTTVYINKDELIILKNSEYNYSKMFNDKINLSNTKIVPFQDKEIINFNDIKIRTLSTPGHTKGSSCFFIDNYAFTGDTLFVDNVGRTDLFSGDTKTLYKSIESLKKHLKDNTMICPGHGGRAKYSVVKKKNPYIK